MDFDDDFGGEFANANNSRHSGEKRSFGDLEDDDDDIFGTKKCNTKVEETAMILSLRESLENCKSSLETCQAELGDAKSEIQKWHSSFENKPYIPTETPPEAEAVLNYLLALKSSEESLKVQLEKAKKKEAAFIITFAKREKEIVELKSAVRDLKAQLKPRPMQARRFLLDPAIHEEFTRLKSLAEEKDKLVKELEDNMQAVNFTPHSRIGKTLMAKCKMLLEENEEVARQADEGKMHELALKLSLQKTQNSELRAQLQGLHKQVDSLSSGAEKSHETVLVLQETLEQKEREIERLRLKLEQKPLDTIKSEAAPPPGATDCDEPVSHNSETQYNSEADS